jgi:phosphoribosylformylglycinamidine synthase
MTRALILRSPGTNCDEETAYAFQLAGAEVERLHVKTLIRGERQLEEFQILALPGGFSYGDDLGAGTVLANQLLARLEDPLRDFVAAGRLVIGICNGFQVLVRLGLLPGLPGPRSASLVENVSGKFEDRWVQLSVETDTCPFLLDPGKGWSLRLPVAHREGRFLPREPEVLSRLTEGGQVALRYIDPEGTEDGYTSTYPANPNGSVEGIAGITNPEGNVLGLMPHPERFLSTLQSPTWTRQASRSPGLLADPGRAGDGYVFFRNAVKYMAGRK